MKDKVLGLGGIPRESYRNVISFSQKTDIRTGSPTTRS